MIKWKVMEPRDIAFIVVHCAATTEEMDTTITDVRDWHQQRGFVDVGYHRFIRRSGAIEFGRPLDRPGAHARGYNHRSWGICLAGGVALDGKTPEDNFTPEQKEALCAEIARLKAIAPHAEVLGHRDLPGVAKACPSFDVREWLAKRDTARCEVVQLVPPSGGSNRR